MKRDLHLENGFYFPDLFCLWKGYVATSSFTLFLPHWNSFTHWLTKQHANSLFCKFGKCWTLCLGHFVLLLVGHLVLLFFGHFVLLVFSLQPIYYCIQNFSFYRHSQMLLTNHLRNDDPLHTCDTVNWVNWGLIQMLRRQMS